MSNEQTEMTEVRGGMKAALTEKQDYCEKKNKRVGERAEEQL